MKNLLAELLCLSDTNILKKVSCNGGQSGWISLWNIHLSLRKILPLLTHDSSLFWHKFTKGFIVLQKDCSIRIDFLADKPVPPKNWKDSFFYNAYIYYIFKLSLYRWVEWDHFCYQIISQTVGTCRTTYETWLQRCVSH